MAQCFLLCSAAFWAQDVRTSDKKTASNQRTVALVAGEAVRVPMTIIERNELSCTKTCNRPNAATALLGKILSKAFRTERLLFTAGELLSSQHAIASDAGKALTMPRCVLVGNSTFINHPIALDASLGILLFITGHANHLLITWDESLGSDWLATDLAGEALLMKLLSFELVLLHSSSKYVVASIASDSKVVVMAVGAVGLVILKGERPIHKRSLAVEALEASLMPMLVLVGQILMISSDGCFALFTFVSEESFIAFDTERFFVTQDVTISGQVEVTVETIQRSTDHLYASSNLLKLLLSSCRKRLRRLTLAAPRGLLSCPLLGHLDNTRLTRLAGPTASDLRHYLRLTWLSRPSRLTSPLLLACCCCPLLLLLTLPSRLP